MVTKHITKNDIWSDEFALTREFLANFGISPRDVDKYLEDDVVKAIHHKGWETEVMPENDPPGWKAEIQQWRTLTQYQAAVAHDPNRVMALLRALRIVLTWITPEEDLRIFGEHTQAMLGLSATEFYGKWRNNELATDDSRVVHLLVMRPLHWE